MYVEDLWRGYFHVKYVANSFKPAHDAAVTSSHFAGLPEPVFVINNNNAQQQYSNEHGHKIVNNIVGLLM